MKQEISMKVNQSNLVKGLRYSFTNKSTVLGELMQNARRAGARQVIFEFDQSTKTLKVIDDGCGIHSLETLLTVAESGWDLNVAEEEHPFGIGFLSALFACQYLTVSSKSGSFSVKTEDVLSFKAVAVSPVKNWHGITEIIMSDIDLTEKEINTALESLATGFPIPVFFNQKKLDSPLSITSDLSFIDTGIGLISLSGLEIATHQNSDFQVFLQGLPIYRSRNHLHNTDHHVIHLDSSSFYARLPDREKLINEVDVITNIKVVLAKTIEQQLVVMKTQLSAEDFAGFYLIMKGWGLLWLLNDVPVVPKQVLSEIRDYPVCETDVFPSFEYMIDKPLSRDEILARGVVSLNEDIQVEGAAHSLFVWKKNHLIYSGNLDAGHWLHKRNVVIDFKDALTIEIVNESHASCFKGGWAWLNVIFCDAYKIHFKGETVEISDMAMFTGNEQTETAILPKGDNSADVLCQAYSFKNEFDEFQESSWETDKAHFISFVVANTSSDKAESMKRLLPAFKGCLSLYGESFVITLDKIGDVESVTLESHG